MFASGSISSYFINSCQKMTFSFHGTDKGRARNGAPPLKSLQEEHRKHFLEISHFPHSHNHPVWNCWVFLSSQAFSLGYKYIIKVPDHEVYKWCEGELLCNYPGFALRRCCLQLLSCRIWWAAGTARKRKIKVKKKGVILVFGGLIPT